MTNQRAGASETSLTLPEALGQAVASYQGGDLEGAERLCRAILAAEADHFEALLLLGMVAHGRGHDEEALQLIGGALKIERGSADAWAMHAMVLRALQRNDDALASYDAALAIKPGFTDALYNRGNVLQALQRHEEALASYDAALAIEARDFESLNNRGVVLQKLGRYHEALESHVQALAIKPDHPEALNNRGNALQALDHYEQALASFDRALATRPDYAEALNNRGNALQALHRPEEALESYGRAIAVQPDYAEAFNNRAVALHGLGRHGEALANCEWALAIRPGYAEALNNRGMALQALKRHEEALACYREAFAIQPDSTKALNLGNALQALDRLDEALAWFEKALSINPDYAEALNNRGNALQALNRHEEALQSYGRAIALKPNDVEAHWNEGLTRLALGDFERGWEKYEWRWHNRKLKTPRPFRDKPEWLGTQDVAGKTVLLYAEQGFGDAIQFIRYAPWVRGRGAAVIVACHESLRRLFQTVEGVQAVVAPGQPLPAFDYCIALMSLPRVFKTRLHTIPAQIPYLSADEEQVARWRRRLSAYDDQLKIGLAWRGNPRFPSARTKSCPVERLAPLVASPGCAFLSLQKGEGASEVDELVWDNRKVLDLGELGTFSDTAALISALDVVITVDTAVAHLAGALGRPAWILLPFAADWRWLVDREDSPWYPTARLFRQPRVGDWDSVIRRTASELDRLRRRGAETGASV